MKETELQRCPSVGSGEKNHMDLRIRLKYKIVPTNYLNTNYEIHGIHGRWNSWEVEVEAGYSNFIANFRLF